MTICKSIPFEIAKVEYCSNCDICFSILLFCRHFIFAYFNTVSFRDTVITKSVIQLSQTNAHVVVLQTPHPLSFLMFIIINLCYFCVILKHVEFFFWGGDFPACYNSRVLQALHTNNLYLHGLNSFYHPGPSPASSTTDVSIFNLVTFTVVSNLMQ